MGYDELLPELSLEQKSRLAHPDIDLIAVSQGVARFYHFSVSELTAVTHGKGKNEKKKNSHALVSRIGWGEIICIS